MADNRDAFEELWLIALGALIVLLVWWRAGAECVAFGLRWKLAELGALHAVGLGNAETHAFAEAIRRALIDPAQVSFPTFAATMTAIGRYCSGPVALLLTVLGVWNLFFHPGEPFRRRFTLATLAAAMGDQWPYALHALRRNQIAIPLADPVWGMALGEWEFAQTHGLLQDPQAPILNRARVGAVLSEQLGSVWENPAHLPLYAQALGAIFALRVVAFAEPDAQIATRLKTEALGLLRALTRAAAHGEPQVYLPRPRDYQAVSQRVQAICQTWKHEDWEQIWDHRAVQAAISAHAYEKTVLLRLLADARQNGILAPALFNWLKGVDRPLWYALTSLGRRAPFAEALGPFAHYSAERQAGQALYFPALEGAVQGLEEALARSRPAPAA